MFNLQQDDFPADTHVSMISSFTVYSFITLDLVEYLCRHFRLQKPWIGYRNKSYLHL